MASVSRQGFDKPVHLSSLVGVFAAQMHHMEDLEGWYSKCSKNLNTFLFLFSNKMLAIRAGIHKMLVRIANREDPDQTASSEAV